MTSLDTLKKVFKTKDGKLVFGFIRMQSINLNIPMLIYYLCLGYYYLKEYFAKCSNGITIENDRSTASYKNGFNSLDDLFETATCHYTATQNRCTWIFKINKCKDRMFICIKEDLNNENSANGFEFVSHGVVHNNGGGAHTDEDPISWTTNDEVVIVLDMNKQTISLGLNNQPLKTLIDGIWTDRGYVLMCRLFDANDSVTLKHFSCI